MAVFMGSLSEATLDLGSASSKVMCPPLKSSSCAMRSLQMSKPCTAWSEARSTTEEPAEMRNAKRNGDLVWGNSKTLCFRCPFSWNTHFRYFPVFAIPTQRTSKNGDSRHGCAWPSRQIINYHGYHAQLQLLCALSGHLLRYMRSSVWVRPCLEF